MDPITAYYLQKDEELEAERQAHLASGQPISTFKPQTYID